MTTHKRAALVVLVLAAVGVGVWSWVGTSASPERGHDPRDNAENSGKQAQQTVPSVGSAATAQQAKAIAAGRYRLSYSLVLEAPGKQAGHVSANVDLQGTLELTDATLPDHDGWTAARASASRLTLNAAARQITQFSAEPARDVTTPWLLRSDTDGRLAEVRFDENMTVGARGVLAAVAAAMQFAQPEDPAADAWQADERDVNGHYTATYTRRADGRVDKAYRVAAADSAPGGPTVPGYKLLADATFEMSGGRLVKLRATQSGQVSLGSAKADRQARFQAEITLERTGDTIAGWAAGLAPDRLQVFDARAAPARRRTAPTGQSYAELVAAAEKAGDARSWRDRYAVANALSASLRADPALVARVEGDLRAGVAKEPVQRTMIEALVRTGTATGQAALTRLAADPKVTRALREQVLAGAAFVKEPHPAFTRALAKIAFARTDSVYDSMAGMTLGAAALHQRATDEAAAEETAESIATHTSDLLAQARAADQRSKHRPPRLSGAALANWMAALGNTGSPQALQPLLAGLVDKSEPVRMAAALALRFQEPKAVLPAMHQVMLSDDSIHVRDNVIEAARYLGAPAAEALVVKALMHDVSKYVRLGAAHTVAAWASEAPGLRKHLVAALAREKAQGVRESLRNYLEPGRVALPFRKVDRGGVGK